MDILAKAKPVRFRIVSAGVECTSLDDLRAHFDLKSVADTINDGRLEKWLNYIKEFEFAKQVKEIGKFESSDMEQSLRVLSLFTGKECSREKFKSDIDVIKLLDKDKSTSEFAIDLINGSMYKDVDVLLYAYKHHKEVITDIRRCFAPFLNTGKPEVLWLYGCELTTSPKFDKDKEQGMLFIKKAAKIGHKEAVEFIKHKEGVQREVTSIINRNIGTDIRTWILYSDDIAIKFMHLAGSNQYSQEIKDIFKLFSKLCKLTKNTQIYTVRDTLDLLKKENYGTAQKIFDFINLYANEDVTLKDKVISAYKNIDYRPATKRAQDLQEGRCSYELKLVTEENISIIMPEKLTYTEFITFLHEFMRHIMYF